MSFLRLLTPRGQREWTEEDLGLKLNVCFILSPISLFSDFTEGLLCICKGLENIFGFTEHSKCRQLWKPRETRHFKENQNRTKTLAEQTNNRAPLTLSLLPSGHSLPSSQRDRQHSTVHAAQCTPQPLRSPLSTGHVLRRKEEPLPATSGPAGLSPASLSLFSWCLLCSSHIDLVFSLLPSSPICKQFQLYFVRTSYKKSFFKCHLIQSSQGISDANNPGKKQAQRVHHLPKIAVFSPILQS